jgi:hypothetical protein
MLQGRRKAWSLGVLGLLTGGALLACAASVAGCGSGDDSTAVLPDSGGSSGEASASSDARAEGSPGSEGGPAGDGGAHDGGGAIASFPMDAIDFGLVGCGVMGNASLPITNKGTAPLAVSARVTSGDEFGLGVPSMTVPPGMTLPLGLTVTPPLSSTAGLPLTGSVQLFTNDPMHASVVLRLTVTPMGASFALQSPPTNMVAFPSVAVGTPAPAQPFVIANTGNAAGQLSFGTPTDPEFSLVGLPDGGTSFVLEGGTTFMGSVGFLPTSANPAQAMISVGGSGTPGMNGTPLCAQMLTPNLVLTGQGAAGSITGWPTGTLTFNADCGGAAPRGQGFPLTNMGAVDAHIMTVTIDPKDQFSTNAVVGQVIPAGGPPLEITVRPSALQQGAGLTAITGTLTITTDASDAGAQTGAMIPLKIIPNGASLDITPEDPTTFGSFPSVVLLQSASQKFTVTNKGTAQVDVKVTADLDDGGTGADDAGADATVDAGPDATVGAGSSPFSVDTATFTLAAQGSSSASQSDTLRFTPVTALSVTGHLGLQVTGPLCDPLPDPKLLKGSGTGGGPTISTTAVTFAAKCGDTTPPAAQTLTIENDGDRNFTWAMSDVSGPGASIPPAADAGPDAAPTPRYTVTASSGPGTLHPGDKSTITVNAVPIPKFPSITDPAAYAAQITITTDVPLDPPHVIQINEPPLGDQLAFSLPQLRFGQEPLNMPLSENFAVVNNANPGSPDAVVTLSVSGANAAAYSLSTSSIPAISAGATSNPVAVTFNPTAMQPYPAGVALATGDSLCTPLPSDLPLTGTGTTGQVVVTPATVAFGTDPADPLGLVNCGQTGPAKTVTVENKGNQPFTISSAALGSSSLFKLDGAGATANTVVPIGGNVTITVTPQGPIPTNVANPNDPKPFSDVLTITTSVPPAISVPLVMQAHGAVIADTPLATDWTFGTVGAGSIGTFTSTIRNIGNAPALVTLDNLQLPSVFGLQSSPTHVAWDSNNGVAAIVGQFGPPSSSGTWSDQGTLTVAVGPNDALCMDKLPMQWDHPTIKLSGSSNSNPALTIAGSLSFPATECGSASPGGQSVTLTNNTNQAQPYALKIGTGTFYKITSAGPGTVPANGTAIVVVTPNQIQPGPNVTPGSVPYTDSLVITVGPAALDAGAPAVAQFTVPISWSLNGAVLTLPHGAGPLNDATNAPYYPADSAGGDLLGMLNTGNESVTVNLTTTGTFTLSTPSSLNLTPGIAVQPALTGASTPTCPAAGTKPAAANGTITFTYGTPGSAPAVCQPFPFSTLNVYSCGGTL